MTLQSTVLLELGKVHNDEAELAASFEMMSTTEKFSREVFNKRLLKVRFRPLSLNSCSARKTAERKICSFSCFSIKEWFCVFPSRA